jgi:predicted TIM-barrel fold metal-dependent hydrolase
MLGIARIVPNIVRDHQGADRMSTEIPILDTHQHLIYPEKFPYSWTADIPQLAGKAFRYDDYLKAIVGTAVSKTIFMEAAVDDSHWHEETRFIHTLAQTPGSLMKGIIATCRPEAESGFETYVESVLSPCLVGFRRILHVEPDELSQRPCFAANVRLLEKYKLTFDLCVLARQIPLAAELARKCPGVQFILDHCGVPDIASGQIDPWRSYISEISKLPNVACKISGVIAYCAPGQATLESVRPYVEHCLEQFGWDQVVWGSDWPVCTIASDLRTWVQITTKIIATADESKQRKLLHENAVRIYRANK